MIANARKIANARMYAVTPEVEAAWAELISRVAAEAGLSFDYLPYPAPQPLEHLWRRSDLGCVFMCGYPIALKIADVMPLAAPIPDAPWAEGKAVYRSDLIVRKDAPFRTLEDTFAGRLGWTVDHSHSGFNALRHHLLRYLLPERPNVYRAVTGNLVTARRILDEVLAGTIDVGPLDGYWHRLIARHKPELTAGIRVIASTDVAPMPAFVAAKDTDPAVAARLRTAFSAAHQRPWFAPLGHKLRLTGFQPMDDADYATTLAWDREAKEAGYPFPA
jgi:ABC-type phosphate/phosphonate transport system substrate-binding protein